jgi:hypothetical protein
VRAAAIMFTDGRNRYLEQAVPSFEKRVIGNLVTKVCFQDSTDPEQRRIARMILEPHGWTVVENPGRLGFAGTYANAWRYVTERLAPFVDYIFSTEDDFTYNRDVSLGDLAAILERRKDIQQVALRRQPWNDVERAAGGLVHSRREEYAVGDGHITQRMFFTTNPSLFRASLCASGWPECEHSEGVLSWRIMSDPDACFAFIGGLDDEPWVTHFGDERAGTGY